MQNETLRAIEYLRSIHWQFTDRPVSRADATIDWRVNAEWIAAQYLTDPALTQMSCKGVEP